MQLFLKLKIRTKLFLFFTLLMTLFSGVIGSILHVSLRSIFKQNISRALKNATGGLRNLVRGNLNVAVKNHLRSEALHNLEIIRYLQKNYPLPFAKRLATQILLAQRIGKTGYIYCLNSQGRIVVHPKKMLLGRSFFRYGFIKKQLRLKKGYIIYDWKNPGEKKKRPKALYMLYFKPWDWIVSVSSYRDEFFHLLDKEEFQKQVLSLRFGKTGYSYVINNKGDVIVHPYLKGNFFGTRDSSGRQFVKEMIRKKNGTIVYEWKNPGEKKIRKKLVLYHTIEELGWLVASSIYLSEFQGPLNTVSLILWIVMFGTMLLAAILSMLLSSYITTPLRNIIEMFKRGSRGEQGLRLPVKSKDELGKMAWYFNLFMEKEESFRKLQKVANTDKLTGLFSRRKTDEIIDYELSRFHRYGRPFALIFCDIDHFKLVNDTYGHDCGDFVLHFIAAQFTELFREQDRIGRWGGEEFIIFLPETEREGALLAAERARKMLAKTELDYKEAHFFITATFGITVVQEGDTLESIVKRADDALYEGKQSGRNRCVLADL